MMLQVLQIVLDPAIPELSTNLVDDADTPELSITIPPPGQSSPSARRRKGEDSVPWYWQQVTEGISLADIPPITPQRTTTNNLLRNNLPTVFKCVEEVVEPVQESAFSAMPTPRTTTSEMSSTSSYCDSNGYGVEGLFKNLFKWKMFVTSQRKKVLAQFNS